MSIEMGQIKNRPEPPILIPPPLPLGKFRCIVADPPWTFSFSTRRSELTGTGWNGAQYKYYRTMTMEEICSLPVAEISADESICFLWAVNALMPKCMAVLNAWGFDYRGMLTWVKTAKRDPNRPFFGTGFWARGATEHLLFGVKGKIKPASRSEVTWFSSAPTRHSEKPDVAFKIAERISGHGTKIELFARKPREGWTTWGNECGASGKGEE